MRCTDKDPLRPGSVALAALPLLRQQAGVRHSGVYMHLSRNLLISTELQLSGQGIWALGSERVTHGRGPSLLRGRPGRAADLRQSQRLADSHLLPLQAIVRVALGQLRDVSPRILVDEHPVLQPI